MTSSVVILCSALFLSVANAEPFLRRLQDCGPGGCGQGGGRLLGHHPRHGGAAVDYTTGGPHACPLRGVVANVDAAAQVSADQTMIFGPFENGFTAEQAQKIFNCPEAVLAGGLDTLLAEQIAEHLCGKSVSILDACGGHADPYHYHERMTCLYGPDATTGHSTRVGTALDGNGIYGKFVAADTLPTDLDVCGGRTGVTPDSNGAEVYYYMIQDRAPFTIGCFGPVASVDACRALYPGSCGDGDEVTVTTADGSRQYDPDCPCFTYASADDKLGSNLAPTAAPTDKEEDAPTDAPTAAPTDATAAPTDKEEDAPTDKEEDAPTDAPTAAPTAAPTDKEEDGGWSGDGAAGATPTVAPTKRPFSAAPSVKPAALQLAVALIGGALAFF